MHTKLSLMYLAKFITVYQLIQKHFCQQYKLQSYDIWVTPFQQFFIYCNFFFFFSRWSFSGWASVPTLKRSHEQRCNMRKARHRVISTVRKGVGGSHDSSSSETSNKTSLLSAPPWREGSQWKLFPSSSSELPSQTQSLLETSF